MKQNKCRKIVISILLIIGILLISFNDVYAACAKCSYSGTYMGQPCPNCDGKPAGGNDSDSDSYCQKCGGDGITSTGEKCTYCNPDITPGENNSNKNKCSKCGGDGIIGEYDPTERKCDACNGTGEKKTGGGETDTGGNDSDTPGGETDTGGNDSDTPGGDTDTGGSDSDTPGSGSGKIDTDNFKPEELTEDDYGRAFELTGTIVEGISVIGTVISILGIIILGIKYMIGSVEQKAEYKKTMWPYLVGCIFIFAITRIVSVIYSLVSQI